MSRRAVEALEEIGNQKRSGRLAGPGMGDSAEVAAAEHLWVACNWMGSWDVYPSRQQLEIGDCKAKAEKN